MASKLSVIFYIILCLEVGVALVVLPWAHPFGLADWGDNFFLVVAAQKTGIASLQHAVSSGWFRGAISGLGVLNLGIAVWEIVHFNQTVRTLQGESAGERAERKNDRTNSNSDHLSDHQRTVD